MKKISKKPTGKVRTWTQKTPVQMQAGMSLVFWAAVLLIFYFVAGVDSVPFVSVLMIISGLAWMRGHYNPPLKPPTDLPRTPKLYIGQGLSKEQKLEVARGLMDKDNPRRRS